MTFFIIALAMCLLAGSVLAVPLWRARVPVHTGAAAANREVHARRLAELQLDLEAGRLSTDDHAAAVRDLETDLASTGDAKQATRKAMPQRLTARVTSLLLLVVAGSLYWFYGSWRVGAEGVQAASTQAVVDMVAQLAARLQTPTGQKDLEGWKMLGHSYMVMDRYPDALKAFEHARSLSGDDDPDALASYAEALSLTDPDAFLDRALPLFNKALQEDPANVQALWYGGLGALQQGDKPLAIRHWQAILAQDPPEQYRSMITKAITEAGGTVSSETALIKLHVSLSKTLAVGLSPDTTVFVYVQPKSGEGGPPLAVRRFKLEQLPLDISLSDQDAMVPGRVISAFDAVVVSARVSKSGTAIAQPGDLLGQGDWMKASSKPLAIVIDTVLK